MEHGWTRQSNPERLHPHTNNTRTRHLLDDEEARLFEAAKTYGGEIGRVIPRFIETAMPRGEIAAMLWEHWDRKTRVLLIRETKNGTPRRVSVSPASSTASDSQAYKTRTTPLARPHAHLPAHVLHLPVG